MDDIVVKNGRIWLNGGRELLLKTLPKYSIGLEIGVHKGEFSQKILNCIKPKKLHLVDPWNYFKEETYKRSWYGGKVGKNQQEMDTRYHLGDFWERRYPYRFKIRGIVSKSEKTEIQGQKYALRPIPS